jgi:hypothetical protein
MSPAHGLRSFPRRLHNKPEDIGCTLEAPALVALVPQDANGHLGGCLLLSIGVYAELLVEKALLAISKV